MLVTVAIPSGIKAYRAIDRILIDKDQILEVDLPDETYEATLRLTVVETTAPGYGAIYATNAPDGTSVLNFQEPGQVASGSKTVLVTGGKAYVSIGGFPGVTAKVIVDVETIRFAAQVESVVSTPPTPTVTEAVDFKASGQAGFYLNRGVVKTGGPSMNVYRVKPGSSTLPAVTTGTTPHRIMRAGALSGSLLSGVEVAGIEIHGYQEQVTHGLTVSYTIDAYLHDLIIRGVKGQGTTPPGETFSLEVHQSVDPEIFNVVIDGRWSGAQVSSSLLGFNSVDGGYVENLSANYSPGFGAALWQSGNYTLEAPDFRYCRRALNLERPYGVIKINRPDLRNRTSAKSAGPDVVVATSGWTPTRGPQSGVLQTSARVIITEPVWDRSRGWPLTIGVPTQGTNYAAGGNTPHTQRPEDVTVVIDGTNYTGPQNNALVRIGNYWS